MSIFTVPVAYQHVCLSGHPCMYCAVAQKQAENRVMRVCGHAPDRVTGVYVLQRYLYPSFIEIIIYLFFQKKTDILKLDVPGCIHVHLLLSSIPALHLPPPL